MVVGVRPAWICDFSGCVTLGKLLCLSEAVSFSVKWRGEKSHACLIGLCGDEVCTGVPGAWCRARHTGHSVREQYGDYHPSNCVPCFPRGRMRGSSVWFCA